MTEVWCFDCQSAFDDQEGHHCVHGFIIPKNVHGKNSHFPTNVEKIDSVSQSNSTIKANEISCTTSDISEVENTKLEISGKIDNLGSMQLFQSSPVSAPGKIYDQYLIINSEQTNLQDCTIREEDGHRETSNSQVSRISNNLPLESSICYSQIVVDNCETNNVISQFSSFEESSMPNSGNKHCDFNMASMNVDSLILNKTGINISSKVHQQKCNVNKDRLLSKNSQNYISKERKLNTEFESTITVPANHIVSKSRETVHESVQEYELENLSCYVSIKDNSVNQQLISSNMSTMEVTQDCTFTASLTSQENELTFCQGNNHGDENQIANSEFVNQLTTVLEQPCYEDGIDAVSGPSCSLANERTCSVCHKEFCYTYNLKQHYLIHSGEKPFECRICQRKFTQKGSKNRHEQTMHKDEKPQIC